MVAEPPRRFADDFRRHVVPVLQREIARLSINMAADELTFPEAMAELLHIAQRRGAGYLPHALYDDLREWISVTLLDEAIQAEEAMANARALIERVMALRRVPSRDELRQAAREFLNGDR